MDVHSISSEMTNGVRLRMGKESHSGHEFENNVKKTKNEDLKKRTWNRPGPSHLIYVVLAVYAILFCLQCYLENYQHPTPLMLKDLKIHPDKFIAERAMKRLMRLTDIGPRVAGSYENEILAVDILKKDITNLIRNAKPIHNIQLDIQKYSGSFPLSFLDGLTNVYRNVQNVIVRFGPRVESQHSLLINCHFDSVPDSPGGSDDGAGCAIMLEILDILSQSDKQLNNNIIFLFNGAEENLMHASHGFITQHPWAKEVRAFINLEACGAGGREVLFQSGPNSPWIMQTYANSVLHPFASSMAQEVFESGIIPGDTDFRVFRDFGNVSGLDFAWSTNGYVYHTKYDNIDQIPLGALQRTGDNILALAQGMANAPELSDVAKHKPGNMIYFDLLGLVLVRWSEEVGIVVNIVTIFLSGCLLYLNVKELGQGEISKKTYVRQFVKTFWIVILCAASSTLATLVISWSVSIIGRSMSWYSRPVWLLFLYVIPGITIIMGIQHYHADSQLRVVKSRRILFQLYYSVYQMIWTSILLVTVILKIRSGYVVWMWVIGPCWGTLFERFLLQRTSRGSGPGWKWLLLLLGSLLLPIIQFMSMQVGCLGLFIPIMGRSGASTNSEVVIALFTNATFGLLFTYTAPLINLVEKPRKVLISLSTLFLAALFFLLFTPLGFPYSGNTYSPKPQRFMLVHTQRSFLNELGKEVGSESGYWIVDHDYNSPHTVSPFVPEIANAREAGSDCEKYLYCGLPYLMPVLSFIWKTHWIPSSSPLIEVPTSLKVVSKELLDERNVRITLEIRGPDHMGLVISPKAKVEFLKWSLNDDGPVKGPQWNGQDTYFIYYACSSDQQPWVFSMDFKVSSYNETLMDLALTSHFLHGHRKANVSFKKMLAQFPPWTAVTAWTATFKSFVL